MRRASLWLIVSIVAALAIFHLAQRELATLWSTVAVRPEISQQLRAAMDDQRRLARLDPENASAYRRRFEELRALHNRLEVLRHGQRDIYRAQERILFAVVATTLVVIAAFYLMRRKREIVRLRRIEEYVQRLSTGETHLRIGERGSDAIAQIAGMIETTSDVLAEERQRLRYLENLSSWQEAARRHAHEIRTPLTAARQELDRLCSDLTQRFPDGAAEVEQRRDSIVEELDRLRNFTKSFTSFASIGAPQPVPTKLVTFAEEFCRTYATAWPLNLELTERVPCVALIDRAQLRQVLVNLCTNSALEMPAGGNLRFAIRHSGTHAEIDVIDNGPGIRSEIRSRLFQPYTTSRKVGEGMGLGLAISRKTMLDQEGDLTLLSTSSTGTTFRLTMRCSSHEEVA